MSSNKFQPRRGTAKVNRVRKSPRKKSPEANYVARTPLQRMTLLAKWSAILGLLCAALLTATVAGLFWFWGGELNNIKTITDYQPGQVNRILSADGELIGEIYEERQRRSVVSYEELPQVLVHALISAEDKNFYTHTGIDYLGMFRALVVNIREGKKKQGASTITQQVVKNLLLTNERTFKRKFQEIILARNLEHSLSKEDILMMYANEIFLGHGRYGVQEASRFYFGKDVQDINVGEAALLAGLPKGPNRYSPKKTENQDRAKSRQIYVLQEMVQNGYLSVEEGQKWIDEPIRVVSDAAPNLGAAPEFVEMANEQLLGTIGKESLSSSGAAVTTTVDLKVQHWAKEALQMGLRSYDERQKIGRSVRKLKDDKMKLELVRLEKRLPKDGPRDQVVYDAIVVATHDDDNELTVDLGGYKASVVLGGPEDERYNPKHLVPSERFSRGSVVRVQAGSGTAMTGDFGASTRNEGRQVHLAKGPEGAVVVIDLATRNLVAMVGGYETKIAGFNRATMAKRQAGSTFKPIVYAAAIDSGEFTAASIVNDAQQVYDLWKPENYKKGTFLGPVRLRYALAKSINTVAISVTHDLGTSRVRELAGRLGIESPLPDGLSLALGSGEVTPLELTNAFATIASAGNFAAVRAVDQVGQEELAGTEFENVLRPEVAYIALDMMRSVVQEGTGAKAAALGQDLAGKTGTSNEARDAWFIGLSPEYAVGVWVGFDDFRRPLGSKEGGSKTALPVFVELMKRLGNRSSKFTQPAELVVARIDKATGLLAPNETSSDGYDEVFLEGTVPTQIATLPEEVTATDAILDQYGELESPPPQPDLSGDPQTP